LTFGISVTVEAGVNVEEKEFGGQDSKVCWALSTPKLVVAKG